MGDCRATVEHACNAWVLRQVAEATLAQNLAANGFGLATQNSEERCLAGAVAANETNLVARHDGERGLVDNKATANLHRNTLHLKHLTRVAAAPANRNRP